MHQKTQSNIDTSRSSTAMVTIQGAQDDLLRQKSDAVWGAEGHAEVLGCKPRRAHYLLSQGALKEAGSRLVGGRWLGSRSKLEAFIKGETISDG